jgi:hypothetical protein
VLSLDHLEWLQPQLATWLEHLQAQPACSAPAPAAARAGATVSTRSNAAMPAPSKVCACQQHVHRGLHWLVQAVMKAAPSVTQVSRSSQALSHDHDDPSTLTAAVGSAAEQLMSLALQVVKGGHGLEALEVITLCFEG